MDKGHKSSMKKYILTTGPALAHEVPLREVHSEKNIYRINGAHGTISDVEQSICNIRAQIPEACSHKGKPYKIQLILVRQRNELPVLFK